MANDTTKKSKGKTSEEIFAEFRTLRNEQRNIAHSLSNCEMDLKEHRTVIDTLKTVDDTRKCFRLIGGVLCESTVKDVLPQLTHSKEQLEKVISVVTDQLTKKGQEINKFKEDNNIIIRGQDTIGNNTTEAETKSEEDSQQNRNVLVLNN